MNIPVITIDKIQQLYELSVESGVDVLGEMIEIFRTTAPARVTSMRGALEAADWRVLEREAHTLKSSAGNLGLSRLQQVCASIGEALRAKDTKKIEGLVIGAGKELERGMRELNTAMTTLSSNQKAS